MSGRSWPPVLQIAPFPRRANSIAIPEQLPTSKYPKVMPEDLGDRCTVYMGINGPVVRKLKNLPIIGVDHWEGAVGQPEYDYPVKEKIGGASPLHPPPEGVNKN
ncbi:hypothetical protein AVEN_172334-1 [Araneus ventricosus]|uniref:Uncharacterized protein n=1 Tax=Araneus ventricosus TaxID=182803 RepID=A0A4Y2E2U6_ARAVE|nr:hypothetical protein AVEN_172334-1 [Araneus ventricosus]